MTRQKNPFESESINEDILMNTQDAIESSPYPKGSVAETLKQAINQAAISAPEHWSLEDKSIFSSLDAKTQNWLLQRHRAMESDYTKKTMELSKDRKKYADLDKIFEEYQDDLKQSGINEAAAVQKLLTAYKNIKIDPAAAIREIADYYGINLSSSAPQSQTNDGSGKAIKEELEQIKKTIAQDRHNNAQVALRFGKQKLDEFLNAKDAVGNRTYPDFEKLLPQILMLAHADLTENRHPDLKDLYERAAWAHPETREQLLSAQLDAAEKKKLENNKLKIDAAKKAGVSVYGTPAANAIKARPARSLREELEAAFKDSLGA